MLSDIFVHGANIIIHIILYKFVGYKMLNSFQIDSYLKLLLNVLSRYAHIPKSTYNNISCTKKI